MKINTKRVLSLAECTGKYVLRKLQSGDFTVEKKLDGSPVTSLDNDAATLIRDGLVGLIPDIPIITEEDKDNPSVINDKLSQSAKWFVDPIDGTRTAIGYAKGRLDHDGWGINIGLVEDNKPVKGFIYFPARDDGTFYFTGDDGKAYKTVGESDPFEISVKSLPKNGRVNVSVGWQKKSHPKRVGSREYNPICSVGGERVCFVADGTSHIAWLNGAFAPWDIAASHAVLNAANGIIITREDGGNDLDYSNENLKLRPAVAGPLNSLIKLGYSSKNRHS